MNGLREYPISLLTTKIKAILTYCGLTERYVGARYLSHILAYMIFNNDISEKGMKEVVKKLSLNYKIHEATIMSTIAKSLPKCTNEEISNNPIFSKRKGKTIYKIRIIKDYLLEKYG